MSKFFLGVDFNRAGNLGVVKTKAEPKLVKSDGTDEPRAAS